jgi:hypothetical protein
MITKFLLLSAALLALLFPNITLGQNPITHNLGLTASFVLFTSEGPVKGPGIISFTGNIGNNSGVQSGFTNLSNPLFYPKYISIKSGG